MAAESAAHAGEMGDGVMTRPGTMSKLPSRGKSMRKLGSHGSMAMMSARQLSAKRLGTGEVPETIFDGDEEFPFARMLGPGEIPTSKYRQKLLIAVSQVHATLRAIRIGNRMTRGRRWNCGVYGVRLSCRCCGIPSWCPCSHEHQLEA